MKSSDSYSLEETTFSSSLKMEDCPLIKAVQDGDICLVKQRIEEGADINIKVEGGWTPLHNAVQEGHKEIVKLLLEKGADPHIRKNNGATPFIVAGIAGNVELLELFLSKGAEVNECDNHGFTAFMEAAFYGQVDALKFLHERGANVNLRRKTTEEQERLGKGGCTALMDAAEKGQVCALKVLLEMGADVYACDNSGRNALTLSLLNSENKNRKAIVSILLKHGSDVNKRAAKEKTPLILAVQMEDDELVQMILEADDLDINAVDSDGKTAIRVAVENKQIEIARMLCKKGAKLDCGDLLGIARRNYDMAMVDLLREYKVNKDCPSRVEDWQPNSYRWRGPLKCLHALHRPMIGKIKILVEDKYRIAETSEGGVYLGFYDGKEAAVKRFKEGSERAEQEYTCISKFQEKRNLVVFYGRENKNGYEYLCFSLCEKTLKEHLADLAPENVDSTKKILKSLFKAVQELHRENYSHQDLCPDNILINSKGEVCVADFDKSEHLDATQQKIKDDLKALGKLVLYVVQMGAVSFSKIQDQSDAEVIDACPNEEIKDLVESLLCTQKEYQNQLSDALLHPFFWNCEIRFSVLRKVGNESDLKKGDSSSLLLQQLNETRNFQDWRSKIDQKLLKIQDSFYIKKGMPCHSNSVGDLLKLIRNLGEHYKEKKYARVRKNIGNLSQYFLNLFPDLVIHVYKALKNTEYKRNFPLPKSS